MRRSAASWWRRVGVASAVTHLRNWRQTSSVSRWQTPTPPNNQTCKCSAMSAQTPQKCRSPAWRPLQIDTSFHLCIFVRQTMLRNCETFHVTSNYRQVVLMNRDCLQSDWSLVGSGWSLFIHANIYKWRSAKMQIRSEHLHEKIFAKKRKERETQYLNYSLGLQFTWSEFWAITTF